MIERVCEHCKKAYLTFPSIRPRFCSSACVGLSRSKKVQGKCEACGVDTLSHATRLKRFCSKSCARRAANLTDKNPSYSRDLTGANNPMFGVKRTGAANPMFGKRKEKAPRWTGGRKVRKDGYVLIVAPDDHPYPADQHKRSGLKYILEHRWVMEQHLGRYLEPGEVVHHRDENRSNNDLSNLQLFSCQAEHMTKGHGQ